MTEGDTGEFVLRKHRLRHLPELRVGRELVEGRFAAGCSMANCNARCCRGGVFVDLAEREAILRHADAIRGQMDGGQVRDDRLWFDEETVDDRDYPSGVAVGTSVHGGKCVFLNDDGACVLQKAAAAEGMSRHALKPFFCWLYPVTIEDGELTLHDSDYVDRPSCCGHGPKGDLTVFDVCGEELEIALGREGLEELLRRVSGGDPG